MPLNSAQLIGTGLLDGFRNRIINGDMRIDQRNGGAAVSVSASVYTVDRWAVTLLSGSGHTVQQSSSVVPSGFTNSLGITIGTGATPGSTVANSLVQAIEGFNVADLGWGSAGASPITLSFWVRCSLTGGGTYGGSIQSSGGSRSYPFTYTISAANTWEYKTITIPGDTTGTWLKNNGAGIVFIFDLGYGSTLRGPAGVWASADYRGATGATNVVATSGATFYITGVQIEKGNVATEFERRSYGTELGLCQRYYQQSFVGNSANVTSGAKVFMTPGASTVCYGHLNYPVVMRDTPTVTIFNPVGGAAAAMRNLELAASYTVGGISFDNSTGFGRISGTASISSAAQGMQFHYTASIEL